MFIQKIDVPIRAYTTVSTYYWSTYFTGQLLEIEFDPNVNTPLNDSTTPVLTFYRNTTAITTNLIFKRAVPSTGAIWRPRYGLSLSTGEVIPSSNFGRPWNFADDRLRITVGQSTDAAALRATLNFYVG